jgi:predicted dehydrogenase
MPEPAKYRVAVIGRTGKGNYGHQLDTVWVGHPRAEIVAVADPDEKGRGEAVRRLGAKADYADFRDMLKKEKPQIVSICDRHLDLHRDYVVACAEHGANMFLEKPLCRTLAEADEMVAACDQHHVKCAIAHQTRYSPKTKAVRDVIMAGKIGDLLELRGHGKCDPRGGGEDLMVLGTHTFDLMRLLAGDAKWCSARIAVDGRKAVAADVKQLGEGIGVGVGDQIFATYGFAGRVVGSFFTYHAKDSASARYWLEIRGSKGQIQTGFGQLSFAYLNEDPTWITGQGKVKWQPITSAGLDKPEPLKVAEMGNWNRPIVDDLIEAIEKDRPPLGSITDGRAALEMILAVYESHRSERIVELPLKNRKHPLSGW